MRLELLQATDNPGLSRLEALEDFAGFGSTRTEPSFQEPRSGQFVVTRILQVNQHRDQPAVQQNQSAILV